MTLHRSLFLWRLEYGKAHHWDHSYFFIYVKDVKYIFKEESINIFADDTNLLISGKYVNRIYEIGNTKLTLLNDSVEANGTCINKNKTEYIFIGSKTMK